MEKANIAVLVSGGGTNLQALIDAEARGEISSGSIRLVVSNVKGAYALERAAKAGIPALTLTKKACGGQAGFEEALDKALREKEIDLVVLAGFLSILSGDFSARWEKRIINIHPSLIPKFCGKGFYGKRVHEAVLAAGEKVSGATVHFVDEGIDTGEIILQEQVPVLDGDTADDLAARVLEVEHRILTTAIREIALKHN